MVMKYKKFGGKQYEVINVYHTKGEALKKAKEFRDYGYLARVVVTIEGYVVYAGKRR
ncbi:hypothetical protein KAX97_11240 [candidate division WOR-3 bacterium]|nr:hypothetical protein [candidate division WOR-3 bacterium]